MTQDEIAYSTTVHDGLKIQPHMIHGTIMLTVVITLITITTW